MFARKQYWYIFQMLNDSYLKCIKLSANIQMQNSFRFLPPSQKTKEDFKVRISNFPPGTNSSQIVQILHQICCLSPFDQQHHAGSCSVLVRYQDPSQALNCERELKGRRFKGKRLMTELVMDGNQGVRKGHVLEEKEGHDLQDEISKLGDNDRSVLFGLLNNLAKQDENLFEEFMLSRKDLLNALLGKDLQER